MTCGHFRFELRDLKAKSNFVLYHYYKAYDFKTKTTSSLNSATHEAVYTSYSTLYHCSFQDLALPN